MIPSALCRALSGQRASTFLLGLLLGLSALPALAQPNRGTGGTGSANGEEAPQVSNFSDKEQEILALVDRQMPSLERLDKSLTRYKAELASWDSILRNRMNIARYHDQALQEVGTLRQMTESAYQQLLELNMEWFYHTRQLTAVYTRYGELIQLNKVNDDLKMFVQKHRSVLFKMEELLALVNNNFVTADFLLNTRLN